MQNGTSSNYCFQCETSVDVSRFYEHSILQIFNGFFFLICRKRKPSNGPKILELCNIAGTLLGESLVYHRTPRNEMVLVSFIKSQSWLKANSIYFGFFQFQLVQLLVCDWLLESRTTCWEMEQHSDSTNEDNNNYTLYTPVSSDLLEKFQKDLDSLHFIIDQIPVSK